jgi:Tol biopolymer transport system component
MRARIPLGLAVGALVTVPMAIGAAGGVTRVSLPLSGVQLAQGADGPVISADGTHVLFTSTGTFSGVPTGAVRQLFSRDLGTGTVSLASATASGVAAASDVDDDANGASTPYASSYDGRFIVFTSTAQSLVAGDGNARQRDVFRKDMLTGAISIVSRDSKGVQPSNGVVGEPSISADGSRVAFTSGSQPLTPDDTNGVSDIYVADLRARTLRLVSRTAAGTQSPGATAHPSISADGRSVAFEGTAAASVLAGAGTHTAGNIYVARVASREITLASTPGANDATLPSLSGDGTRVAFVVASTGVQVRNLTASTTTSVPQSAPSAASRPVISNDGGLVAYTDTSSPAAVTTYALAGGISSRISQTAAGAALGAAASRPALAGNGTVAGFAFNDAGAVTPVPVAGDSNLVTDVFATQTGTGDTTPPTLTARATASGTKVVISGRASDASGITEVLVGGRRAVVADDGSFGVTLLPVVGTGSVSTTARDGNGLQATVPVATDRAWAAALRASAPARPRGLRVTITGGTARVRFATAVSGLCRVELRQRTPGTNLHVSSYRLIAARQRSRSIGVHVVTIRLPRTVRSGSRYQVRVLTSSSRGMGTASTTIIMP